jgi:hypothetical protein
MKRRVFAGLAVAAAAVGAAWVLAPLTDIWVRQHVGSR